MRCCSSTWIGRLRERAYKQLLNFCDLSELSAITLHALYSMPRPLTCPRAKVWLRRHSEPMCEAVITDMTEAALDFVNCVTPSSLTMLALALVVIAKYWSARLKTFH